MKRKKKSMAATLTSSGTASRKHTTIERNAANLYSQHTSSLGRIHTMFAQCVTASVLADQPDPEDSATHPASPSHRLSLTA